MKSRLSRETAQAIREDILEKIPQAEILQQYGIKKAMFSRIKSGKWFQEQAARDAKNGGRYPKGMTRCPLCHKVVQSVRLRNGKTTSCLECEVRVLPTVGTRSYTDQFVAESDLDCHLMPDEEAARQEVRAGLFEGAEY